jgi:16S rRNA (guanine527-N7)-methyltransferase
VVGADARAGRDTDHSREDRKDAFGSIFVTATDQPAAAAREAREELERLLADEPELEASLPPTFGDAAERYVAMLLAANEQLNLTRITSPEDVARLHLLDALAALPLVDADPPRRAIDLGTGGGIPGLVLAMARLDIHWTLLDASAKKVAAVRDIAEALGLPLVITVAGRAETLGHEAAHRDRYNLVTARAVGALPVLLEYSLPLLRIDGRMVAWKGPLDRADPEVAQGRAAAFQLGGGRLSLLETGIPALGGHSFVVVVKERATPAAYPRRPGEPGRRPLA